jgi:hypothetical protein
MELKDLSCTMGYVIHNWDETINPSLQSGETKGLAGIILDSLIRAEAIDEEVGILNYENGAGVFFKTSIYLLKCLYDSLVERKSLEVIEYFRLDISRYLNQMDICIKNDSHYELAKKGV